VKALTAGGFPDRYLLIVPAPPSDDVQHRPSILVAEAVVKSDDRTMPDIASDRMTAILSMVDSFSFCVTGVRLIVGHEARDAAVERRGARHPHAHE